MRSVRQGTKIGKNVWMLLRTIAKKHYTGTKTEIIGRMEGRKGGRKRNEKREKIGKFMNNVR